MRSGAPLPFLCLVLAGLSTEARSQAVPPGSSPAQPQQVEVKGSADVGGRRDANAAKVVITSAEIARFGDVTLGAVLQRISGVSVSGSSGQAREIRMRGLGGGYTQILINGEVVSPYYSLGSISPDLIERIEVIRSATADVSGQSIAGTINIILKRTAGIKTRQLKTGLGTFSGLGSANATLQLSERDGLSSYGLTSAVRYERDRFASTEFARSQDALGGDQFSRRTDLQFNGNEVVFELSPRYERKVDDSNVFGADALLSVQRFVPVTTDIRSQITGTPPEFRADETRAEINTTNARSSINWKRTVDEDVKFELKASGSFNQRRSNSGLSGFDAEQVEILHRTVESELRDVDAQLTGRLSYALSDLHVLTFGVEMQRGQRSENRRQKESSLVGHPTLDLDESYSAKITRVATFGQSEWTFSPAWSAYLGVRWEGLKTRTSGQDLEPLGATSSVLSPTSQLLWKIPGTQGDQVRLALGRTYKAPTTRQLVPRRWVVNDNSPTAPDFEGNPRLQPELAWGLDFGYERYLPLNGFWGVSAYARQIDNVILPTVFQRGDRWISSPANAGTARVFGIEVEATVKLKQWIASGPDLELRAGLTRNWSKVALTPGPNNRLGAQPSRTASAGFDWRPAQSRWMLGAGLSYESDDLNRTSATQSGTTGGRRSIDTYALWTLNKELRFRFSVANILRPVEARQTYYTDASIFQVRDLRTPTLRVIRGNAEFSF